MVKEMLKDEIFMVNKPRPKQVVFESSQRAFIQPPVAEQNLSSTESVPAVEDVSMVSTTTGKVHQYRSDDF